MTNGAGKACLRPTSHLTCEHVGNRLYLPGYIKGEVSVFAIALWVAWDAHLIPA